MPLRGEKKKKQDTPTKQGLGSSMGSFQNSDEHPSPFMWESLPPPGFRVLVLRQNNMKAYS